MRGKLRFAVVAFALALGLAAVPAAAQFVEDDCSVACNAQSDCSTSCHTGGSWTTCGGYSTCNSDPDGDGWHTNDNCPYQYNPNQANCDGDSQGDVCDAEDSNYQQTGPTQSCYIVDRLHFLYRDQRLFQEGYFVDQSSCGKPPQWRKVAELTGTCYLALATSATTCCLALWNSSACALIGNNQCHF